MPRSCRDGPAGRLYGALPVKAKIEKQNSTLEFGVQALAWARKHGNLKVELQTDALSAVRFWLRSILVGDTRAQKT